jgi:hypothetical protein
MRKTATLIVAVLPVLLGLAAIAQAKPMPCRYTIVECKTNKNGDFLVVAFSNATGNVPSEIDFIGLGCTEALDIVENDSGPDFFFVDHWITSGSQDRTVYTAISSNCD